MAASVKTVLSWSKRDWENQAKWEPLLEEAYRYALPHRNTFMGRGESGDGQSKMEHVFDSTPMISAVRATGRIQRDLMPPYERSYILEPGPLVTDPNMKAQLAAKLDAYTDLSHTVLSHSNFPTSSHEAYFDLLGGRCSMQILRGSKAAPINCVSVPRSDVAIHEGAFGKIDRTSRRRNITRELVEQEYDGAEFPKEFPAKDQSKETKHLFHEVTYFEDGKWKTKLIWEKDGVEIWKTTHRRSSPWIHGRYFKITGETDGRGPLLLALPDIRTLNRAIEMVLQQAALALAGVYTVTDDDVVNLDTVAIAPGVFIKVERNAGAAQGPSIATLATGRDFDMAQIVIEQLRTNIKKILIDNELPPEDGSVRSPTEYLARKQDFYEDTGSAYGRMQTEWVMAIAQRVLDVLSDPAIGLIEDVDIDQLLTRVQVTSPIASVQKLKDVKAVLDWIAALQQAGGPQLVALTIKLEDLGEYFGDRMGVPSVLRRSPAERQAMQQQVAQIIAAQQMAQQQPAPANSNTGAAAA